MAKYKLRPTTKRGKARRYFKKAITKLVIEKPRRKSNRKKRIPLMARMGRNIGGLYGPIGAGVGEWLGKAAHNYIPSVFGRGDYVVSSNSLLNAGDTPPVFATTNRITTVRHREYLRDVFSGALNGGTSTIFSLVSFDINPGLFATFPWLSAVALNYEVYRIKGMLFEYKSMSASALNSTNTALGTVIMATQYNSVSPPFINKQQMENYEFSQSCKPAESMLHYIECEKFTKPLEELYIRGSTPPNASLLLYDLGRFSLATVGMQAENVLLGELWVTYDIELLKPKMIQGEIGYNILSHYSLHIPSSGHLFNAVTQAGPVAPGNNSLNVAYGSGTGLTNEVLFPQELNAGIFHITVINYGSATQPDFITGSFGLFRCEFVQVDVNNVIELQQDSSFAQLRASASFYVRILGQGAAFTLPGIFASAGQSTTLMIDQVYGNI